MLRMIGYGDTAGSGFPTILAAWAEKNWPEPELDEDTILNQVTLTLTIVLNQSSKSLPSGNDGNENGNDGNDEVLSNNAKRLFEQYTPAKKKTVIGILKAIDQKSDSTLQQIADTCNISKRTVSRYMKELQDSQVIYREGTGRSGRWVIQQNG